VTTRIQKKLLTEIERFHDVGFDPSAKRLGARVDMSDRSVRRHLAELATLDPSPIVSVTPRGGSGATRIVLRDCPCARCEEGRNAIDQDLP